MQWSSEPAVLIRVPFGRDTKGMKWTDVDDDFLEWVLVRDFSEEVIYTVRLEIEHRRKDREAAAQASA